MKSNRFFIIHFILLCTLLFTSCEANKHITVTVFDAATNQPVDSVKIKVNAGTNGDYNKSYTEGFTDENGKFETYLMIGCAFGCYDIYIEYQKNGYIVKKDLNITEGNILLTPN